MNILERIKYKRHNSGPLRVPSKSGGRFSGKRMPIFITVAGVRLQVGWARDYREQDKGE